MTPIAFFALLLVIGSAGFAAWTTAPHITLSQPMAVVDNTDGINYQHNLGGSGGALTDTVPNCTRVVDRNTNETTWSGCI